MDEQARNHERRKQAAFRRLGTDRPQCVGCGEDDWRCLERHHAAGRASDPETVILCRNCHRKLSDPSDNAEAPAEPPLLERIGRFLLGLAALFLLLAAKLKALGRELIDGAKHCPRPYGWLPAAAGGA